MADDTFLVSYEDALGFAEAIFIGDELNIPAGECFEVPSLPPSYEGSISLASASFFSTDCFIVEYTTIKFGTLAISSDDAFRTFVFEIKLGVKNHDNGDDTFEIIPIRPTYPQEYIGEEIMQQGDVKITFVDGRTEIEVSDTDLLKDAGFETAMTISLFTDARLSLEELNQAKLNDNDLRGYWADALSGENTGSKLRLLSRSKVSNQLMERLKQYAKEAWQWMIDEGAVKEFIIKTERDEKNNITIVAEVYKPNATESSTFKFALNWSAQLSGG
jgi:phage gp46-like protein